MLVSLKVRKEKTIQFPENHFDKIFIYNLCRNHTSCLRSFEVLQILCNAISNESIPVASSFWRNTN